MNVAFRAYFIPTCCMAPAIDDGDRILVNQLTYLLRDPKRWEIAVFLSPENGTSHYIKRIVGLPGDRIESVNGRLILNGEPVPGERGELPDTKDLGETVPEGGYYVLGDARYDSFDSRHFGIVPAVDMLGPAQYIVTPPGRFGSLLTDDD